MQILAAVSAAVVVYPSGAPLASADPGIGPGGAGPAPAPVVVYPGMEIRQDTIVCTLGYVDPVQRIAFSAGHCRGNGPVTDSGGRPVGMVSASRDNTPDGTVVFTDQVISDYETIGLAPDVAISTVLPGGRQLVSEPTAPLASGQAVCHFGVSTGESCGSVERVNNGWFTMNNGVVNKKGDSGGPVYTLSDNGRAVIVGLFNSTWGDFPTAVSWQATGQQLQDDFGVVNVAFAERD